MTFEEQLESAVNAYYVHFTQENERAMRLISNLLDRVLKVEAFLGDDALEQRIADAHNELVQTINAQNSRFNQQIANLFGMAEKLDARLVEMEKRLDGIDWFERNIINERNRIAQESRHGGL